MSKNGKFWGGLIVGVLAGAAAKVLMDNKEQLLDMAIEKVGDVRNEVSDFVDYAQAKISLAKAEIEEEFDELKEELEELREDMNEIKGEECCCTEAECDQITEQE